MKQSLKNLFMPLTGLLLLMSFSSYNAMAQTKKYTLAVAVNHLRNAEGVVVFALYNRDDAFPDEHYEKYLKKITGKIINGSSSVIFENLPTGKYAVNILHDENMDGKIKKGFIMPVEGIGFSNYQSVGIGNKPKFSKASFDVFSDLKINVKVIYL